MYWHVGARGAFKAPAAVGILIYNAYSALYSDSHNYRALRASPSPFLSRSPSPSLTLSGVSLFPARIPFSRLFPRPAPPHSLAITNTVADVPSFFSPFFSPFPLLEIRRENVDENSYEQYATTALDLDHPLPRRPNS